MKSLFILFVLFISGCSTSNWQTASRESAQMAPLPSELDEAIVQIYTARAFSWRSYLAVHPWITWKEKSASSYTVAQVTSWALRRGKESSVIVEKDLPDRYWYGHKPNLIFEIRGEKAEKIIAQMNELLKDYPFKSEYSIWPGPNSNTFVEYMIRNIPELTVELPPEAIGKDYLGTHKFFSLSPGGYGVQLSVFGALGFTVGLTEGIEINLLGLTFGIDIWSPAIKIPFWGRVGFKDRPL